MPRRILNGRVVSDAADKTIVVMVERRFMDPLIKKTVRRRKKFHAHDPSNDHKIGDHVAIRECRPLSKLKSWEVLPSDPAKP